MAAAAAAAIESLRRCSSPFTMFSMLLRSFEVDRDDKSEGEARFLDADVAAASETPEPNPPVVLLHEEPSEDELQPPSSEFTGVPGLLEHEGADAIPQSGIRGGGVVDEGGVGCRWCCLGKASGGDRRSGGGGEPSSSKKPPAPGRNRKGDAVAATGLPGNV